MTPVPVAVARNTNTVAESRSIMTDEELQQAIQDLSESIDSLPKSDKPLSKEERRRREMLLIKKEVLHRIKEAREKKNTSQELYHSVYYGLLTSWGEKHPYWVGLIMSHFRWGAFQ